MDRELFEMWDEADPSVASGLATSRGLMASHIDREASRLAVERLTDAVAKLETTLAEIEAHFDSPAMAAWRRFHVVSRSEHRALLEQRARAADLAKQAAELRTPLRSADDDGVELPAVEPTMANLQLVGTFCSWDRPLLFDDARLGRWLQIYRRGAFDRSLADGVEHVAVQIDHGRGEFGALEIGRVMSITNEDHGATCNIRLFCLDGPVLQHLQHRRLPASFQCAVVDGGDEWTEPTIPTDANPDCLPICTTHEGRLLELGPCTYPRDRSVGLILQRNFHAPY